MSGRRGLALSESRRKLRRGCAGRRARWSAPGTATPGGGMVLILPPCWLAGRPICWVEAGCWACKTSAIEKKTASFIAVNISQVRHYRGTFESARLLEEKHILNADHWDVSNEQV